jgi:hypothetical protein
MGVADEMAETLFPVLAGGDALAVDGDREIAEEEQAKRVREREVVAAIGNEDVELIRAVSLVMLRANSRNHRRRRSAIFPCAFL